MRRWIFSPVLAAAVLLLLSVAHAQDHPSKKRVAVLNFDGPALDAASGGAGLSGDSIGMGVSAQLIQKLVDGGKYTVVDRSALEKAINEQKDSDRAALDAYGMAAKIGRELGLDAMILGAVTRYGPDDKSKAGGALHAGMRTRQSKAFVEITAKIFIVSTGQVIESFTASGESAHTGTVITFKTRDPSTPTIDTVSSDFPSLFNDATHNAVAQLATQLNTAAAKIPVPQP
jgi:curli biogenesis system outer membrane secretion channel CsgG